MREIKFRGKVADETGEWVYGYLISKKRICQDNDNGKGNCGIGVFTVVPDTIGQYTGVVNRDNEEIYEGDTILHHFGDEIGVVRFGEYTQPFNTTGNVGFYIDWVFGESKDDLRKDLGYWTSRQGTNPFIGNIYDNPELIKNKQEADSEYN